MQAVRKWWLGLGLAALIVSTSLARQEATSGPETAKWLVQDAEAVLVVNVKQIFSSKVMAKGGAEAIRAAIAGNEQARMVTEATGLDPTKDLDSIMVSGTLNPKDPRFLIVVRGRFDQDKIQTAAAKHAKTNPDELKLLKEDGKQLYQLKSNSGGDQTLIGGFIDSTALVLTPSKEATLEAIKNAGKKNVKVSKVLQPALSRFKGKESLAMALVINDEVKKNLEKAPQAKEIAGKLQSVSASLTLTDAASLKAAINTEDAAAAKKTVMLLTQLKGLGQLLAGGDEMFGPVIVELLNALKITDQDSSVNIELEVTKEMIEKAQKKDK
jgi:hypothetical protein